MVKSKVTKTAKYWKETLIALTIIMVLVLVFFLYRERIKEKLLEKKEKLLEQKEKSDVRKLQRQIKKLKKKG